MKVDFNGYQFGEMACRDSVLSTLSVIDSLQALSIKNTRVNSGKMQKLVRLLELKIDSGADLLDYDSENLHSISSFEKSVCSDD